MKARTIKGNSPDEIKLVLQYSIVGIKWKDYGNGILQKVVDKIFQPPSDPDE